jgi:DNA (cytosine-5)-methyltransferase 1
MTCEIDTDCQRVYRATFPNAGAEVPLVSNIRELTRTAVEDETALRPATEISALVPDHDVLCGGFPCQPFSKSGEQQGARDRTRGTLFHDIMQLVEAKRPKFVFLENVRNIAGPRHLETWETVIDNLRLLGYRVSSEPLVFSPHLLPPNLGGAPQVRDRVFILGVRADAESDNLPRIVEFNAHLKAKRLWNPDAWRIEDYLIDDLSIPDLSRYCVSSEEEMYLEAWNYFVESVPVDTIPGFPIWAFSFRTRPDIREDMPDWKKDFLIKNSSFYVENQQFLDQFLKMRWGKDQFTVLDFPVSRQILEWQARRRHPTRTGRTLRDLVVQFRPSGIRVKPPTYLPALVAITQTSVVGPLLRPRATRFRRLTPVEAARLQGIPDEVYRRSVVSEKVAYKQLGNAVNVGIVRAAAEVFMGISSLEPRQKGSQRMLFCAPEDGDGGQSAILGSASEQGLAAII